MTPIAVLGAGSWGTALALQLARAGHEVILWGRDAAHMAAIDDTRCNARYLPGIRIPDALAATADLEQALGGAALILIAVPSRSFRGVLAEIRGLGSTGEQIAWATKGFELDTGLLPHQVVAEVLPDAGATAVLSGPTFANEVAIGLPSAMTIASADSDFALSLAQAISTDSFRAYTSRDIIGVEVGGATKNVFAIGAGISDGLGFGANTRIALLTRGLAEMTRLGLALGANQETFMGLAGMGDLVLTCTDDQSRNRRFGLALARGDDVKTARAAIGQVVEGYFAAKAVNSVAKSLDVSMPIVEQIYRVLYEGVSPRKAVAELMARPIMAESS
jgi:glycerol-3-phosphate dehydrogenase (NAD(P)+)